jgi:hypothetical protein
MAQFFLDKPSQDAIERGRLLDHRKMSGRWND